MRAEGRHTRVARRSWSSSAREKSLELSLEGVTTVIVLFGDGVLAFFFLDGGEAADGEAGEAGRLVTAKEVARRVNGMIQDCESLVRLPVTSSDCRSLIHAEWHANYDGSWWSSLLSQDRENGCESRYLSITGHVTPGRFSLGAPQRPPKSAVELETARDTRLSVHATVSKCLLLFHKSRLTC